MIKAYLTNFGKLIYVGDDLVDGMAAVERAGFEAAVSRDGSVVACFSPITGWKIYA